MPVWKARSLDQMPTWTPGGHQDPLTRAVEVSDVAQALAQRAQRRGVFRFRSSEEAWRNREAWERSTRLKLPLVECAHAASPTEEMTPDRVARVLLDEEAGSSRGAL
jgi:hypothetical protein